MKQEENPTMITASNREAALALYVPEPRLDEWIQKKQPSLTYPDGQRVWVGDWVDFGMAVDPESGEGWPGQVLAVRGLRVVVDTWLNQIVSYQPDQLRLVQRADGPAEWCAECGTYFPPGHGARCPER